VTEFARALPVILLEEGGFYDGSQPWDPHVTMHGITQQRYDVHRGVPAVPSISVQRITDAEVKQIYLEDYWVPSHADALTWPLSLLHFDFAVNAGPEEAIRVLQRVMDLDDDGIWGPQTAAAAALASHSVPLVARDLLLERLFAYNKMVLRDHTKVIPLVREWIPRMRSLYGSYVLKEVV